MNTRIFLTTKAVESATLPLESIEDVHGCGGLAAGVLGVGHGVADDRLKENLEHTTGLLVDEAADALDTAAACEAANSGLGDTLDVVPQDLPVPLGTALTSSLFTFAASRHIIDFFKKVVLKRV